MLVFLSGNEPFLAHLTIGDLKRRYLAKNDGLELINIDATEGVINWADIQATPLFSQTRLIVIKEASALPTSEQESLASFVSQLPSTTILVIWEGSKSLAKTSPLLKVAGDQRTKKIDVSLPIGQRLKKYLLTRANFHGVKLTSQQENFILSELSEDLWTLDNELANLALGGQFSGKKKTDAQPFELYRFVYNNNWPAAKKTLLNEYASGSPIELLVGSIASALRKQPVSSKRREITNLLADIDTGLKTGWLDEAAAVALLQADLPTVRQNRVEWEELWEESLGG